MAGVQVGNGKVSKFAVQLVFVVSAKVEVPEPAQFPDHPEKIELGSGVAERVRTAFVANVAAHCEPQDTPAGVVVIKPVPTPVLLTAKLLLEPRIGHVCAVTYSATKLAANKTNRRTNLSNNIFISTPNKYNKSKGKV